MEIQIVNYEVIMKKENKVGGLTLPDFETYYKVIVTTRVWYWHNDRQIRQWNRVNSPDKKLKLLWLIGFDKGTKVIKWGEKSLFNKLYWVTGYLCVGLSHTKHNS